MERLTITAFLRAVNCIGLLGAQSISDALRANHDVTAISVTSA